MLLGTSNLWFPEVYSTLALPAEGLQIDQLVEENWANLQKLESTQNVELIRNFGQLGDFIGYSNEEIWDAIQRRHNRTSDDETLTVTDLKTPGSERIQSTQHPNPHYGSSAEAGCYPGPLCRCNR